MNQAQQTKETPAPLQMLQLMSGFWISRCIYVAAKLGIADLLKDGPKSSDEIASATRAHAPSLFRVLRALAAVGIVTQGKDNRFSNTPLLETLRSDTPESLRAFAITELGEEHYPAWGELLHSVRTGGIAFEKAFGMPVWEFFGQNPENAKIFNDAMSGMTAQANEALHAAYSFAGIKTIIDVGGGHGGLITSILQRNPQMRGILFDAPQVIEGARSLVAKSGVGDRCELVAGDFFKSVPAGGDVIIMKWIIHDWNDDQSVAILRNCHQALPEKGKLILVEAVIPPEFAKLYEDSGFRLTRVVPTESLFSVIEGVKV